LTCHIRVMSKGDISQVTAIDREAFPTMWPPVNFNSELTNRLAHYIVAADGAKPISPAEPQPAIKLVPVRSFLGLKLPFTGKAKPTENSMSPTEYIIGFVGMWNMVDEAHIINIAVRASHRGKGVGELLLVSSIDMAKNLHAQVVTLEVRVSNKIAQNLYSKYGFVETGVRKNYYTDNKEDALIMTTDNISSLSFTRRFQSLKSAHFAKFGNLQYQVGL
jgi:ribosomal-protein-alanine N-acetyltransferase